MTKSLSSLWVLIFIFGNNQGSQGQDCDEISDCRSCTNQTSWNVDRCRWCPLDRRCHAYASPVNPCTSDQSFTEPSDCEAASYGHYNPQIAYEQAVFSTAAYSDDPELCLSKLMPGSGFEVVDIIKASCDDFIFDYGDCFAFTALSCERKTILLAFRGTQEVAQLVDEVLTVLATFKTDFKIGGKVQKYFSNVFNKMYPCVLGSVTELLERYPDFNVRITGHSLGGAIASMSSAALVHDRAVRGERLSLYTFGQPRVGDKEYAINHDKLVKNSWRIVHYKDIVSHLPLCNLVTGCDVTNGPYHHQTEVFYPSANMTKNSSYIICSANEDTRCSNGIISGDPCITHILQCVDYHLDYFGIPIGTFCDQFVNASATLRFKRYRYETCLRTVKLSSDQFPDCQAGVPIKSSDGFQIIPNVTHIVLIAIVITLTD